MYGKESDTVRPEITKCQGTGKMCSLQRGFVNRVLFCTFYWAEEYRLLYRGPCYAGVRYMFEFHSITNVRYNDIFLLVVLHLERKMYLDVFPTIVWSNCDSCKLENKQSI